MYILTPHLYTKSTIEQFGKNNRKIVMRRIAILTRKKTTRLARPSASMPRTCRTSGNRRRTTRRYIGVPIRVVDLFSPVFASIFEWVQLYTIVVTLCVVHCITCFLYVILRLLFPAEIKENDPKITLQAKRNTYEGEKRRARRHRRGGPPRHALLWERRGPEKDRLRQ